MGCIQVQGHHHIISTIHLQRFIVSICITIIRWFWGRYKFSIIVKFIRTHHHRHQLISLLLQLSSLRYNISSILLAYVPPPWPQVE